MISKELLEVVSLNFLKIWQKIFKFKTIFAWRPIYNANITLAILYRDFTNNAFTKT